MYVAIWQKILDLVPRLAEVGITIMGDYEAAVHSATHRILPIALLLGCWFHFVQALIRKWKSLGLVEAPKDVLWMSMSLGLLPAAKFGEALVIIQGSADIIANEYPRVLEFMVHMRRQWLPRAHIVSAYRCPVRMNNEVEAFNRQLINRFGGTRRNMYTFLGKFLFF